MTGERRYWVRVPDFDDPFEVAVSADGDGWRVVVEGDGESRTFRLAEGPGPGRAWVDDRPATLHWTPGSRGPARLVLDGLEHALEVATEAQHRLEALGIGGAAAHRAREVRAPMPGLVLEVEVAEGDEVAEGAGLLVIEAMKMENEILAPIAGVVTDLAVAAGEAVEQGALLCRVDPSPEGA